MNETEPYNPNLINKPQQDCNQVKACQEYINCNEEIDKIRDSFHKRLRYLDSLQGLLPRNLTLEQHKAISDIIKAYRIQ